MRTEELIRALATDVAVREPSLERRLAAALCAGFAIAVAMLLATLGPRPHLLSLLTEPRIAFKFLVTLSLAVPAALLVLRLARPGASLGGYGSVLALAPTLLALAIIAELFVTPPSSWEARLVGSWAVYCLASVPLLSLPLLAAALIALRHGAPTRPGVTGALAGLMAGGFGAAIYASHCPDDSPLFVAAWYSLAIGLVALLGALAGRRVLRW